MCTLRREVVGDRRVSLVEDANRRYTVTIEVCVHTDAWEDISLRADQNLAFDAANRRYRQRLVEQQARALGLHV
jgi:hypothetical protein